METNITKYYLRITFITVLYLVKLGHSQKLVINRMIKIFYKMATIPAYSPEQNYLLQSIILNWKQPILVFG